MSRNYSFHTGSGVPLFLSSNLNIGLNTKTPQERLQFASGHAKFTSNLYVMQNISVGHSNPGEAFDVLGNTKVSSNLYVMRKLGVGASNAVNVSFEVRNNDAILIPKGTTAQRPSVQETGQIRYNTDINQFEGYGSGNAWGTLGGVKDTNQDTYISAESFPTSNDDILRFYNSNVETMRITIGGNVGIGSSNPQVKLVVASTDAIMLPTGTSVQRPANPVPGYIRYNTTINQFEGYASAWGTLGGVKDTNQDTYISAESFPTSNDDIIRFYNSNIETARVTQAGLTVHGNISASNATVTGKISGSNLEVNRLGFQNIIVKKNMSSGMSIYGFTSDTLSNEPTQLTVHTPGSIIRLVTSNNEIARFENSNLGIRTNGTTPEVPLHVIGNAYLGQGFFGAASRNSTYGGPFFKQESWDQPASTHIITYPTYCIGDNSAGTLHIQVSNKLVAAQSKVANIQVSFIKRWGRTVDIFIVSLHRSTTMTTMSVTTNLDHIVVNTDSDCSIAWTSMGSY